MANEYKESASYCIVRNKFDILFYATQNALTKIMKKERQLECWKFLKGFESNHCRKQKIFLRWEIIYCGNHLEWVKWSNLLP